MTARVVAPTTHRFPRSTVRRLQVVGLVALTLVVAQALFRGSGLPDFLDTTFSDPLDRFARWAQANRRTHWLFTVIFRPITAAIDAGLSAVEDTLLWIPWFVIPLGVFALIARSRDYVSASFASVAIFYTGFIGLWDTTMETLALMAMAVAVSVLIGVPLGIAAAFRPRLESVLRPLLDAMQTVPAPVYFVPMALFFGIGKVPATLATVIYALPPVVRLTTLGIREVPEASVDASRMFGADDRQTLRKVQVPMAKATILTGVTQTIMMALGIVVLATLLGAGGLGQEVMDTLNQRRTGRGLATGLAIVAVAAVLDRMGRSFAETDRASAPPRRHVVGVAAGLVALTIVGRAAGVRGFPEMAEPRLFDPIDDLVRWMRDNLAWFTRPFNDFIVSNYYVPVRDFLTDTLAWPVLLFASMALCWWLGGRRLAVLCGLLLSAVLAIGMWELSIDTLVQVVAAVVLTVLVAVPLGVVAGRRPRVEAAMRPVLDALQTIPSLVYIIPAVTLFTIGVVPGIIASVLYAMVPGVRLAALGIRQVPEEAVEASTVFGATPRQTMFGVRVPLAARTIMAGINQVIMMVLAMVIISGLVGGGGLGFETISAVKNSEVGLGFEVGFAIVAMAIILDRCTQAIADRVAPPT